MLKLTSFKYDDNKFEFNYGIVKSDSDINFTDVFLEIEKDIACSLNKIGYKKIKFHKLYMSQSPYKGMFSSHISYKKEVWEVEYNIEDWTNFNITITKNVSIAIGRALKTIADRLRKNS